MRFTQREKCISLSKSDTPEKRIMMIVIIEAKMHLVPDESSLPGIDPASQLVVSTSVTQGSTRSNYAERCSLGFDNSYHQQLASNLGLPFVHTRAFRKKYTFLLWDNAAVLLRIRAL